MSLAITITDPDKMDPAALACVIRFLSTYAGLPLDLIAGNNEQKTIQKFVAAASVKAGEMVQHIAHDDRPDTGAPAASEVFGKAGTDEPNPASVFGGNGAPAIAGAVTSTTVPVASAAISTSTSAAISTSTSAPLPPAAPPAPPAATAAQNTASPAELDKDGLPWDGRIHAESRAKIADQTWRRRRNITDEYYAQVVAELRAVMGKGSSGAAISAGSPAPLPPVSSPAIPPAPPSATVGASSPNVVPQAPAALPEMAVSVAVPAPPPAINAGSTTATTSHVSADAGNVPPAPPPPAPISSAVSPSASDGASQVSANFVREFPKLCKKIAEGVNTGALSNETLSAVLAKHNLPNLPTLAAFPHLVPAIAEALGFTE